MSTYLGRTWLLLLALTLVAVLLSRIAEPVMVIIAITAITMIKGRSVMRVFMGLDRAPRSLRLAVGGWLVAVTLVPALLRLVY